MSLCHEDIKGYELIEDNEVKNEHIEKNEEDEDMHDDISEQVSTFAPSRNGGATANADAHL